MNFSCVTAIMPQRKSRYERCFQWNRLGDWRGQRINTQDWTSLLFAPAYNSAVPRLVSLLFAKGQECQRIQIHINVRSGGAGYAGCAFAYPIFAQIVVFISFQGKKEFLQSVKNWPRWRQKCKLRTQYLTASAASVISKKVGGLSLFSQVPRKTAV